MSLRFQKQIPDSDTAPDVNAAPETGSLQSAIILIVVVLFIVFLIGKIV